MSSKKDLILAIVSIFVMMTVVFGVISIKNRDTAINTSRETDKSGDVIIPDSNLGQIRPVGGNLSSEDEQSNQSNETTPINNPSYDTNSQPDNKTDGYEPYSASSCEKIILPRASEPDIIEVDWMYEGDTQLYKGSDGYRYKCSVSSRGEISSVDGEGREPRNDELYVGTTERREQSGSSSNSSNSSDAGAYCSQFGDSSAQELCLRNYGQ